MSIKLKNILNVIIGNSIMPGWVEVGSRYGSTIIVKDLQMKDKSIKCVGVCNNYALIFSTPYEKTAGFLNKPQYCIIVLDKQSLQEHMDDTTINEVLEASRRIQLA